MEKIISIYLVNQKTGTVSTYESIEDLADVLDVKVKHIQEGNVFNNRKITFINPRIEKPKKQEEKHFHFCMLVLYTRTKM